MLLTPANGATNVPVPPTFTWTAAAQAGTYSIQIATDAGFTNIVDQASGLTGTTYTPSTALNTNTMYYWRVQATNTCGTSNYSEVFNFRTVAAPGDCAVGTTPNILLNEGFETGANGWTHSGTGDSWAIATTTPHSGLQYFHANDPASVYRSAAGLAGYRSAQRPEPGRAQVLAHAQPRRLAARPPASTAAS